MTNQRTILGNSAGLIAAEVATRGVSLLTILYLSRTLTPGGMGAVAFGFAVFTVLQLLTIGGIDALLTHEAAHRPSKVARFAGKSLLLAGSQFGVAFVALVAGAALLGLPADVRQSAVLFALAAATLPAGMRFAFFAGERVWVLGLANLLGYVVFLALCVVAVRAPEHVARVGLFWIAATALRNAVSLAAFVHEHGPVTFDTHRFGSWLRRTVQVGVGSVARGLMTSIDIVVLGLLRPAEEVASYALAVKLPLFLASLVGLFYTALFPMVARAVAGADTRWLATIQVETIEVVLGVALPGALCLGLVAEPLVVLLFTERFRSAAPLLTLLVWRFPLSAAVGLFRTVLWARSPQQDARVAVEVFAITLAALPLAVVSAGAAGTAWCMLLGSALAVALYAYRAGSSGVLRSRALARLGVSMAVAGALMLAVPRRAGLVTIAGALGAWALAALVAELPYVRRLVRERIRAPRNRSASDPPPS